MLAQAVDQRGLARADRPADADPERAMERAGHERNSLVYCVSCRIEHQSTTGTALPSSSRSAAIAAAAAAATDGASAAMAICASVWPSGTRRSAADTRLAARAAS